jgi:hypothetical protein
MFRQIREEWVPRHMKMVVTEQVKGTMLDATCSSGAAVQEGGVVCETVQTLAMVEGVGQMIVGCLSSTLIMPSAGNGQGKLRLPRGSVLGRTTLAPSRDVSYE